MFKDCCSSATASGAWGGIERAFSGNIQNNNLVWLESDNAAAAGTPSSISMANVCKF